MGIIWASMGCRRDLSALATIRASRSRRLTETIFCLNRVTFIADFTRSKILCRNRTGNRKAEAKGRGRGKGEGGRGRLRAGARILLITAGRVARAPRNAVCEN